MSYWDTSCLIKIYTPESDSAVFRNHLASGPCATCEIASLEFWTTVRRKEAEGGLPSGGAASAYRMLLSDIAAGLIVVVALDRVLLPQFEFIVDRCHAQPLPIFIRTNDAVHLAAARVAGETEVVATDKRLRQAAAFLGFAVFPR